MPEDLSLPFAELATQGLGDVGQSDESVASRASYRKGWRLAAISLTIFVFALALRLPRCNDRIFLMDSADYVRAARNGFWTQYVGSDSISLLEFVRSRAAGGGFRMHPWSVLLDRGDGSALRHFHAPASFYLYALAERLSGRPSADKIFTAAIGSATIALLFAIAVAEGAPLAFAGAGAIAMALSPALIETGSGMTPHPLFSLAAMSAIAAFSFYQRTQRTEWLAAWVVATSIAMATLEFSILLIATFAFMLGMLFWRSRTARGGPFKLRTLLWASVGLIVCLFALWPAGFFRGGYVLSYGTLIFQGINRQREQRDVFTTLLRLGSGHLWIGIMYVVLLAIGVYGTLQNRRSVLLATSAVYAVLMFLEGKSNGFANSTYASHAILAIVFLTMLVAPGLFDSARWSDRFAGWATICILGLMAIGYSLIAYRTRPKEWNEEPSRVEGLIAKLEATYKPGTTFAVNTYAEPLTTYAPMFHFIPTQAGNTLSVPAWRNAGRYYLIVNTKTLSDSNVGVCVKKQFTEGFWISCDELP
jgi:hypothetical protein